MRAFSRARLAARGAAPRQHLQPQTVPLAVYERVLGIAEKRASDAEAQAKALSEGFEAISRERAERDKRLDDFYRGWRKDNKAHADWRYALLEELSAGRLARALTERDVARGRASARTLAEDAVTEAWGEWEGLGGEEKERVASPAAAGWPLAPTQQRLGLRRSPGLAAYLQVAEEDNGLAHGVLVASAATLYAALCAPPPARAARAEVIAFAALLGFGGRCAGNYLPRGERVPVVLCVPPLRGHRATLQDIRGSAKLPSFEASVELGTAGMSAHFWRA